MPDTWRERISKLQPGHDLELTPAATIRQTVEAIDMVSSHSANTKAAKDIAREANTLADVFNKVLSRVKYKPDTATRQTVRTLDRAFRDGVGNCVDYTAALSAILKAKGISHSYRLAGYGLNGYDHIYIMSNGKALDPVTGQFNTEAPYKRKRDIMPKLTVLNGPVEDVTRITSQAAGNKPDKIYNNFGGIVRSAVRLSRDLQYNANQASAILSRIYGACDQIGNARWDIFSAPGSHRNKCNNYVNRKADDIVSRAIDPLSTGGTTTGGTGSGTQIGTSSNPRPTGGPGVNTAGFNLTGALPLLAIGAGALLLTKKKGRK